MKVKYLNEQRGRSDGESPRLGKGPPSPLASITLATGLGPHFCIAFFWTSDYFLMLCEVHLIEQEHPKS